MAVQDLQQAGVQLGGLCGEIEQRRRGPAAQHFIHAVLEAVQAVLQSEVQHARPSGRPAQERLPGRDAEAQVQHHPALADFGGGGQEAGPLRQDAIHQELDRRQVRFLEVRGGYHLQGLDLFRFALCSVAVRFRGPAPLIPAGAPGDLLHLSVWEGRDTALPVLRQQGGGDPRLSQALPPQGGRQAEKRIVAPSLLDLSRRGLCAGPGGLFPALQHQVMQPAGERGKGRFPRQVGRFPFV